MLRFKRKEILGHASHRQSRCIAFFPFLAMIFDRIDDTHFKNALESEPLSRPLPHDPTHTEPFEKTNVRSETETVCVFGF